MSLLVIRHLVRVTFANGNKLCTQINGTKAEVEAYYAIGRKFNLGRGDRDDVQQVKQLEFLNSTEEPVTPFSRLPTPE